MNSKKEVIAASILAIGLALGLGTISYSLFSEGPPTAKLESALDVYTQKGGLGVNVSDGSFEPFDNVSVYAYLTQGGVKLKNRTVTFLIERPDEIQVVRTALTNDQGIAETDIDVSPSEGHVIGTWDVLANATVDNAAVNDTLDFQCKSQSARIDVFSERNGVSSTSFLPNDTVLLEAQLSYKNASIAGTPVTFDVTTPNGTKFPSFPQNVTTNGLGTANVTFDIPWPSDFSLGIWHISATSEVFGQTLDAATFFDCEQIPSIIDVFTQKGGIGANTPGGTFALNESVVLHIEVQDELNQGVPGQSISFAIKDPNGTPFYYGVETTNSSGLASIQFRIPPDPRYVGDFQVYTLCAHDDIALLDTLTFTVKQD